jgi:hypothetical protein
MAILFALSDGDISTAGSLNSAASIGNPGTIGSTLSSNIPLATATSYTTNNAVYGIALCLSAVGSITPGETIKIRLSTTNYIYDAMALGSGLYSNSYITTQPQAMVGWIVFKFPEPVIYPSAPPLSVFGPSSVKLMGTNINTPASILLYGLYNSISQPADTIYLTKSLTVGFNTEIRNVVGNLSCADVYICDGAISKNNFDISKSAANNIYIGRGGMFTGSAIVTGLNMQNQFIYVLDGATLSANFSTPTTTGRIKAVSGAIVDLNNVNGFSMLSGGLYNTGVLTPAYDYLHDITTGYARFNNTTFWAGISSHSLGTSVSNLSVYNSIFNEKYKHTNTVVVTSNNFLAIGNKTINNFLLSNISVSENVLLSGNYNSFVIDNGFFAKELKIISSNFNSSVLSNTIFAADSSINAITLSSNTSLPIFNNSIIMGRKRGIVKYDNCAISINGLSCLSSYYHSISALDLTGDLSNLYFKDSIYGNAELVFNNSNLPLVVNGLTVDRTTNTTLTTNTNIGNSILTAYSPFSGLSSLLLSLTSASIVSSLPKILTYDDDITLETWYSPISSKLTGNQSLITIWDPLSTTSSNLGCVLGLYINSAGLIVLQKGLSSNGTTSILGTVANTYELINSRWYHIALVKSSNIYTIYFDGKFVLSANTFAANEFEFFQPKNTGSYNVYLGARPTSRTTFGDSLCGYIGGARISYGANYVKEFNVPTSPFNTTGGTLFNLTNNFSGEYSNIPRVFIDMKNNKSYQLVSLNNLKFLTNNILSSSLIDISNSAFEKLEINSSDLRTYGTTLITNSDKDYIMGSYIINRCDLINPIVDATTIKGYQPYIYRESGFASQYINNDPNNNYRWTQGGKVSLDSSTTYLDLPTEKLESISDVYPLKSNIKLIPVSHASNVKGIILTYKTPSSYDGGAYLKIDKNTILNINEDTIIGVLSSTNNEWNTVTFSLSDYSTPWPQKAYLETYIELNGKNKQVHIGKWQVSQI